MQNFVFFPVIISIYIRLILHLIFAAAAILLEFLTLLFSVNVSIIVHFDFSFDS